VTTADEEASRSRTEELPTPDESTLWLVSFGDDDDREMRAPEIAQALRRGEIRADTIVWREGLPEWVTIDSVPLLARLLVTSGETRAAPAVIGKIPLVQREDRPKPAEFAPAPVRVAGPATASSQWEPAGTLGRKRLETLSGVGEEATPAAQGAIESKASADKGAATPAWKGRTRIGLPKMDEPLDAAKPPLTAATGTPLPGARPAAATGTPLPGARAAAAATGTPLPGAKAVVTGTPLPGAKIATAATTQDAISRPAASLGPKPGATASKGGIAPLEPKRPEARAIDPKAGAKPGAAGASAPRATVPKAAPVPAMRPAEGSTTKIAETPTPIAKSAEAAATSAPAASDPLRPVAPAPEPVSSPIAVESSPEPDTAKTPALPSEPEPPTLPQTPSPSPVAAAPASPKPPKAATLPEPPKIGASPEPPAARQMSRKPEPKAPPLRHRESTSMGPLPTAKSASTAARTGATNIWEDDEPVKVDPESVRPPPPVHAIAEARAQGAPGLKKRTAPKPPSPKRARSIPVESEEPTIPISTSPPAPEETPLFETPLFETPLLETPLFEAPKPVPIAPLSAPPIEEFAKTPAIAPVDTTPTIPREAKPQTPSKPAEASTASVPPVPEKRRSLFPFVLLGAAAAAVAITFFLRKQPEPSIASTPVPEHTAAAPEPTHAEVATAAPSPAEPEQAAPSAAETTTAALATAPVARSGAQTAPTAKPPNPTTALDTSPSPKEPKPASAPKPESASKPETTKPETTKPETTKPVAAAPVQPEVSDVGGDFDRSAAASALGAAAGIASGCRKPGDPTGVAVVHVTFANSGRATRALVEGPPFAGTPTGGCIADALRSAKVPPYGGDRVTVTKRVVIQ
jgi:hypothetical protein